MLKSAIAKKKKNTVVLSKMNGGPLESLPHSKFDIFDAFIEEKKKKTNKKQKSKFKKKISEIAYVSGSLCIAKIECNNAKQDDKKRSGRVFRSRYYHIRSRYAVTATACGTCFCLGDPLRNAP